MKELTIEEKSKRYDEAIIEFKPIYDLAKEQGRTIDVEEFERIFPEIKESKEDENEKIRKKLISYLSAVKGFSTLKYNYGITNKEAVAWLEKQGEQKPAWSEEDDKICKAIIDNIQSICKEGYFVGNIGSDKLIDWLKSLKEYIINGN